MRTSEFFVTATVLLLISTFANAHQTKNSTQLSGHPLAHKIYDTRSKIFLSRKQLERVAIQTRHILLGEIHDNPIHHIHQAWLVNNIAVAKRRPTVIMEMIAGKHVPALLAYRKANPGVTSSTGIFSPFLLNLEDQSAIRAALDWDKSGWPSFKKYQQIFGASFNNKLSVLAGEPAPDRAEEVAALLDAAPLTPTQQDALEQDLRVSHCGVLPDNVIPKIAVAQRKRDIKLALAMRAAHATGKDGTILIAGSGHARKDRGVPHYLRHLGEESVTLNFREVVEGKNDPLDLIEPGEADYIWFTPRHEREDPCIALRKRFGKTKK